MKYTIDEDVCNSSEMSFPEVLVFILYKLGVTIDDIKKKLEDKIFKALVDGYNCKEISKKVHYSERTIQNRRKDIYYKTKKYMN